MNPLVIKQTDPPGSSSRWRAQGGAFQAGRNTGSSACKRPSAGASSLPQSRSLLRARMNEGASYAPPQPLNEVMIGGTVGEFVDSCNARFEVGDTVLGMGGWQQYSVIDDGNSNRVPLCMGDEVPLPGADGRDRGASTRVGVGDV